MANGSNETPVGRKGEGQSDAVNDGFSTFLDSVLTGSDHGAIPEGW